MLTEPKIILSLNYILIFLSSLCSVKIPKCSQFDNIAFIVHQLKYRGRANLTLHAYLFKMPPDCKQMSPFNFNEKYYTVHALLTTAATIKNLPSMRLLFKRGYNFGDIFYWHLIPNKPFARAKS